MNNPMHVLVVGATGGSGRAAVERLLTAGHHVTAFSRSAHRLAQGQPRLRTIDGDATDAEAVARAVRGHDAVVVALGIAENPLRVRLLGARGTRTDIRSLGTRHVIEAMARHGVHRLVVQSSYGVGETRNRLGFMDRLVFNLLLKPQIQDTERQEALVRASDLDWVLVQPVHLTDATDDSVPTVSTAGNTGAMKVSRRSVAHVLERATHDTAYVHASLAVSGRVAA